MTGLFVDVATPGRVASNRLFYGDNLTIMQNMPSACVDLIYLDPPFNSQRNYNLIYKQITGLPLPEQEEAFCDAWEMDPEKEEMARNMPIVLRDYGVEDGLIQFWEAWIKALRTTQPQLLAYLVYMSYRLFEMRRLLKPTGCIYLHCDPTASHYIKVMMDGIFGAGAFKNEIIWRRSHAHSDTRQGSRHYGRVSDTILFYAKGNKYTFNVQYTAYDKDYVERDYRRVDAGGRRYRLDNIQGPGGESKGNPSYEVMGVTRPWRYSKDRMAQLIADGRIIQTRPGAVPQYKRYLDEMPGVPLQNVWTDMPGINNRSKEWLGYPTQKPVRLLERIIKTSTNEGDVVFDPFCGCGTTIYAAHLNNRKWIGCDIAIWSIRIVRDVLLKRYGVREEVDYKVAGVPLTVEGAQDLFERDPRQFQHWVVELAGGFPSTKHSGDRGVDGRIYYETPTGLRRMVLSVKGGKLAPAFVRELRGTYERETETDMAGFICLQEPTRGMRQEVADAGMFKHGGRQYPCLQIRTVADLLGGKGFETPSRVETLQKEKQAVLAL